MPWSALALVLLAAVLHATWNIAAKQAGGDERFTLLSSLLVCVVWLPAGLWFGWQEVPHWGLWEWGAVTLSAAVHLAYFNTLLAGYRAADLSVVYPVARGSAPLLTALVAVVLLGEVLSWWAALGVLGVGAGVFCIAGGPRWLQALWRRDRPAVGSAPGLPGRTALGIRWGLATGALIACYSVIDGMAIKLLAMGPVIYDYLCNVLRVPMQLPTLLRHRGSLAAVWRAQWRAALVVATLGPLAYICVLTALQWAPLSHVAPAREASMLIAAWWGGTLLREGDRAMRLAGAALICAGVVALGWPA